jgi:putative aldouronate transport system substrate-binding protein
MATIISPLQAQLEETRSCSRRALLRAALGAAGTALLAACGGAGPAPTSGPTRPAAPATTVGAAWTTAASTTTTTAATARAGMATAGRATVAPSPVAVDGKLPSPAPGVPDAYLKLPPVFQSVQGVPGKGGTVTAFFPSSGNPPVPPRAENAYWQALEQRLGVTYEPAIAPGSAYQEKLAALTAGGDLPDLTLVDLNAAPDHTKVIQQGAYTDLTPYLAGDALKEYPNLAAFPPQLWKNVALRGKIWGVPRPRFLTSNALMYRQDWVEKLGQPLPRNADDFLMLMGAFTRNDPDGNGAADTWGLVDASSGAFNLAFLENMFRVPNEWRFRDGRLTYYLETEEFKQALAFARRLFEAGVYHPETVSMTTEKARNAFQGSKAGCFGASVTGLDAQQRAIVQINPTARIRGLVPFGHDGGQGVTYNTQGFYGFTAIPAKVSKDKERVRELLRILNYHAAPFGSEEWTFLSYGLEGVHHTIQPGGTRNSTEQGKREIPGLKLVMNPPEVIYEPTLPGFAEYYQGYFRDLLAIGIDNPVLTAYSPTVVTKARELDQLRADRATALITGREPLTALDGWIQSWRSRGGDQIRKEYEAELKEQ